MSIRLASVNGRAQLVRGDRVLDLERASGCRLPADPMAVLAAWDALADWNGGLAADRFDEPVDRVRFDPPVPRPAKVFAIGLNYRAHAEEAG
ncbi:MAG TPA: fumarylacetoacetate hydrolase, partial [Candidatus Binatia bacterium]|nr:fumarylacetoacetate hydrolase [Candidatus Binatia bacterium]